MDRIQRLTPIIARITLRVGAGAIMAKGFMDPDLAQELVTDPDVAMLLEMAVGGALLAVAEAWHYLANKYGWAH